LLPEIRRILAERDQRLRAYQFVAVSQQDGAAARHEFYFRSPNRSRGVLRAPQQFTLSFDGSRFFKMDEQAKKLEVVEFKGASTDSALFLAATFTPFVPEGFRTPLLPLRGVSARLTTHPRAKEAIALRVTPQESPSESLEVTYLLRFPTGDFLQKRSRTNAGTRILEVIDEQCDEALRICVPAKLEETYEGKVIGSTNLSSISLNADIAVESFSLVAPSEYLRERRDFVGPEWE
jgi:hypothetical protein